MSPTETEPIYEPPETEADAIKESQHRSTYDPRAGHIIPSHADYARTLAIASKQGVLSTIDREDGSPYGSIVEILTLEDGHFVFFVSSMAAHTKNLRKDARASLIISEGFGQETALALSRATFMGVAEHEPKGRELYRERYLKQHPDASVYIDFSDFSFFRLNVQRVRYIGGFGRMSWIDGTEYTQAQPDLLWSAAPGIIKHMNEDHQHNMKDYAHAFAEIREEIKDVHMTLVDQFGFELRLDLKQSGKTVRISFTKPLTSAREVRPAMIELAKEARKVLEKE
ncbi:MAG: DUF2470 domain-containing protein [Myxococcota bacterium]